MCPPPNGLSQTSLVSGKVLLLHSSARPKALLSPALSSIIGLTCCCSSLRFCFLPFSSSTEAVQGRGRISWPFFFWLRTFQGRFQVWPSPVDGLAYPGSPSTRAPRSWLPVRCFLRIRVQAPSHSRSPDVAGLHHRGCDWWPGVLRQHRRAGCDGWRAGLSVRVAASPEGFVQQLPPATTCMHPSYHMLCHI